MGQGYIDRSTGSRGAPSRTSGHHPRRHAMPCHAVCSYVVYVFLPLHTYDVAYIGLFGQDYVLRSV